MYIHEGRDEGGTAYDVLVAEGFIEPRVAVAVGGTFARGHAVYLAPAHARELAVALVEAAAVADAEAETDTEIDFGPEPEPEPARILRLV